MYFPSLKTNNKYNNLEKQAEMNDSEELTKRHIAARKAAEAREVNKQKGLADAEALGKVICTDDHTTWAAKAKCLWPDMEIVGEGQVAVWDPAVRTEIRLYGRGVGVVADSPGLQVAKLRRGIHRKGGQ
ncbi:MAG: hypothetical protein NTX33_04720 [Propionibacteriales bacterium]|nr:hypothetical protein [Propionibacteriales bacterium]